MESSDSLLNTTASSGSTSTGYNEWRGGGGGGGGAMGRKPSLPLQLSPHNSFIVLRNVTSQVLKRERERGEGRGGEGRVKPVIH